MVNRKSYTIKHMCKALKFPGNSYYKALLSKNLNKKQQYETFNKKVMEYYLDSKKNMEWLSYAKLLMIIELYVV